MTREAWRDFICAPDRAGRHLSAIGRGVAGATSDAIDLAMLQSFLEKLHDTAADMRLLSNAVDLIVGGYSAYAKGSLHRILDSLSNEMLAQEQIVGPGLRGNPRWDRTILQRMGGTLSPVHYVSRTSHRSFELPENQLISWLLDDLGARYRPSSRGWVLPRFTRISRNWETNVSALGRTIGSAISPCRSGLRRR
jgi:hypothetical protein